MNITIILMTRKGHHQDAFVYINRQAPTLDSIIGLLEEPNYVLYLGKVDLAEQKIYKYFPETTTIMTQRQFDSEDLRIKYYKRVATIDVEKGYQLHG